MPSVPNLAEQGALGDQGVPALVLLVAPEDALQGAPVCVGGMEAWHSAEGDVHGHRETTRRSGGSVPADARPAKHRTRIGMCHRLGR